MIAPTSLSEQEMTTAVLFGGTGGFSTGAKRPTIEYGGKIFKTKLLCSIDYDPVACLNHDKITGGNEAVVMDLFTRQQYIDWHGKEPPEEWREAEPWDLWKAFGYQVPYYLFTSPPCKGLSALLPKKSAESKKYQALNLLTLRGIELSLRACIEYGGRIPAFVHLENVPRILTRGKDLLKRIRKLLEKYGFVVDMRADHNLGEVGGLGQNRLRFQILARDEAQVPNFVYLPPKKPLKTIGDVIGPLPAPGDTVAGGPLHRLPKLRWKTWLRLALIPAGGDWRDLNKVDYKNLRVVHDPRRGAFEVADWNETSRAVTSTAGPGRSNGVSAVSDPRLQISGNGKTNIFRVQSRDEPATCVTGSAGPNQGAGCIADPTLQERAGRHPAVYRIVRADEPAPCITGTRFGSGAVAIADPMVKTKLHPDSYGVQDWDASAKTVRSANRIMQAAGSIADPRITSVPRADTMGVQAWEQTAKTVTGSMDVHAGAAAVSDPRIPEDNEAGIWTIIAQDGTWHRPLTTYELAMLQSFPQYLPDGRPFQLEGCSDAKAREYIGNAYPPDAAEESVKVILLAFAKAQAGVTFEFSWEPIWVQPERDEESQLVH
ncbi:DNA cytosine methyltransferase [Paenibacillus sp. FSL R5-0527]|uniref:DNA cytosine methyltransferase n=1 Tax=Paenibacillus sp. FSL R5-0527 TaxID=2975321 RepID=UPI00097A9729|nr:DNA cytosine methyltransferase [Paenibacillus macerans]